MESDQNLGINKIPIARPILVWGTWLLTMIFSSHKNRTPCKKALFGPVWYWLIPFGPAWPLFNFQFKYQYQSPWDDTTGYCHWFFKGKTIFEITHCWEIICICIRRRDSITSSWYYHKDMFGPNCYGTLRCPNWSFSGCLAQSLLILTCLLRNPILFWKFLSPLQSHRNSSVFRIEVWISVFIWKNNF